MFETCKLHICIQEEACRLLEECSVALKKRYLEGQPTTVKVHGVECMNDDPTEVNVLYAKVTFIDESSRLQNLVDWMVDQFTSAGLMQQQVSSMQREDGDVKLHVTLMNTKFQKKQQSLEIESNERQRSVLRESFDATQILQVISSILLSVHQPISSKDCNTIKPLLQYHEIC
jgi:activating signal cointegrator complex subunit 1